MTSYLVTIWVNVAWLIKSVGCLVLIIAINYVFRRLFDRFKQQHHLQQSDWRYNLDQAIFTPFRTLLWILFSAFIINLVAEQFDLKEFVFDPTPLRNAGIVICATWFMLRWKSLFKQAIASRRHSGKKSLDPASIEIIGRIYTIAVFFIATLIILQNFGLNIAPLLAFSSIGAAVLGFASKDVISNLFGGMTIYVARPFLVNDFIELPQKKLMGTIEGVGWYFTTLRDLSKKPFYIPNAIFTTEFVVNYSRMTHRYINEVLSICYADAGKVDELILEIRGCLALHADIDKKEPIHVYISSFSESSIQLEIKAYTIPTRYNEYMEIKQKILIRICEILAVTGANVGYPVRKIYLQH